MHWASALHSGCMCETLHNSRAEARVHLRRQCRQPSGGAASGDKPSLDTQHNTTSITYRPALAQLQPADPRGGLAADRQAAVHTS